MNTDINQEVGETQLDACLTLLHVVESLEIVSNGLMKECEGAMSEDRVRRGVITLHHNLRRVADRSKEIARMSLAVTPTEEDDIPHDGPYCKLRDKNPPSYIQLSQEEAKQVN